ncbi:14228_t:CDS:2 [Entrophospora sp. SA101]|nr:14228_t:CDS:2 [Entrophospora sp. SA101]
MILSLIVSIISTFIIFTTLVYFKISNNINKINKTNGLKGKTILLLISHPDDECMFFGPTLLNLKSKNDIIVLCLSNGNQAGIGEIRTKELEESCLTLGIKRTHVNIENNHRSGISGHLNHISAYNGAKHFIKTLPETNVILYKLVTVNIIRKYISIFDSYLTYLNFILSSDNSSASSYSSYSSSSSPPVLSRDINGELNSTFLNNFILFISSQKQFYQTREAMECHKSQLVWFRYLYLRFSRYMFINELERVK